MRIDLTEYDTLCDLQFQRDLALREYVVNQTPENKSVLDQVSEKIDKMVSKALKEIFSEN